MQTFYKFLGIIVLSIAIFSGCQENPSDPTSVNSDQGSLLKGSGPSANGQGRISGTDRVFSFHVTTRPNGTVQGQGTLNRTDTGTRFKFDIDCISVVGNVATMSGTVTNSNNFPNSPGSPCWFRVQDNGEGSNAPADEITFWVFCPNGPEGCEIPACGDFDEEFEADFGTMFTIEAGNIQVKL